MTILSSRMRRLTLDGVFSFHSLSGEGFAFLEDEALVAMARQRADSQRPNLTWFHFSVDGDLARRQAMQCAVADVPLAWLTSASGAALPFDYGHALRCMYLLLRLLNRAVSYFTLSLSGWASIAVRL